MSKPKVVALLLATPSWSPRLKRCNQYLLNKVSNPRTIGVWLSGFYAGKRNMTVVDPQTLDRNAERVSEYCGANCNMALMQAVEATLGAGK